MWISSHGWAKAGQPARIYIQQLCADTGCSIEVLLGVMKDREGWRERVREICAGGATWWWWCLTTSSSLPRANTDNDVDWLAAHELTQFRTPSQTNYQPADAAQTDFISTLAAKAYQTPWSADDQPTGYQLACLSNLICQTHRPSAIYLAT